MTSIHDIEKQIENELLAFNLALYFGVLPKDFMDLFKKCLLEVSPMKHQIKTKALKELLPKKENKLTFLEVGMCINVILEAPMYVLGEKLDDAVEVLEKIEKIKFKWNEARGAKHDELIQKKQRLIQLSQGSNGKAKILN